MKRLILGAIAACAISSAQAQWLNPVSGALFGGVAGGVIAANTGGHAGAGVAIGLTGGLLLGSIAQAADRDYYYGHYGYARPRYYAPFYRSYYSAPPNYYPGATPRIITQQPAPPAAPAYNNYSDSTSAMSSANSLFGR